MPRHSAPRALLILLLLRGLRQRRRHLGSDSFTFSTLDSANTNGELTENVDRGVVLRQHIRLDNANAIRNMYERNSC